MQPGNVFDLAAVDLPALKKTTAAKDRVRLSQRDQLPDECVQRPVALGQTPIVPAEVVVLTIGIVVAELRSAHFVSPAQHRHPLRKQEGRQHVPFLPHSQVVDGLILRRPFDAAVPTQVVVVTVLVVLAVLSHLSKDNNSPVLVEKLFKKHAKKTNIIIASRY